MMERIRLHRMTRDAASATSALDAYKTRRGPFWRMRLLLWLSGSFGKVWINDKPPSRLCRSAGGLRLSGAAEMQCAYRRFQYDYRAAAVPRSDAPTFESRGDEDHRVAQGRARAVACDVAREVQLEASTSRSQNGAGDERDLRRHGLRHGRRTADGRIRKTRRRAQSSIASPMPPVWPQRRAGRASGSSARRSIRERAMPRTRAARRASAVSAQRFASHCLSWRGA